MKTPARGVAAAALLVSLAACADLGALGPLQTGSAIRVEPRTPLAHSFAHSSVLGHVDHDATAFEPHTQMPELSGSDVVRGPISWYGPRFAGRKTANGEIFDPRQLTMAHRKLPFNTRVRVTNPENGASVVVRVNDRGPFVGNRVADLSHAAAKKLGMVKSGVIDAELEVLGENGDEDEDAADEAAGSGPAITRADASRAGADATSVEAAGSAGRMSPAANSAP